MTQSFLLSSTSYYLYLKKTFLLLLCSVFFLFTACNEKNSVRQKKTPDVGVIQLHSQKVSLSVELSGRVSAFRKAEVRPQVGGILQRQLFSEGSLVHEGQSLYKIDPSTYDADVRSAKAALSRVLASMTQAELRLERRKSLLGSHAVSKQAMEDAEAEYLQAKADVEVCRAALLTAEIRLRYTDVLAPITGRIGKSHMTQGALVTANQTEPLAIIQQLDPVYVDMTRSSLDLLKLRDRYLSGRMKKSTEGQTRVRLMMDDDHPYPLEGKLQFADISVDESTGMILLRAVFPNPDGILLPGLYVRAFVQEGIEEQALLLPQVAVHHSARGQASVWVVDEKGLVHQKNVRTAERVGKDIVIAEGLQEGELVIVEGSRQLKEGDLVRYHALVSKPRAN
ncbi:MAG: efflux RND transporter periplasmic adaptor subunit [Desulfovibrio sp.]|nr:efflux RND transporter periplasmic adaptor subunit [Desulfovibrio sp.]